MQEAANENVFDLVAAQDPVVIPGIDGHKADALATLGYQVAPETLTSRQAEILQAIANDLPELIYHTGSLMGDNDYWTEKSNRAVAPRPEITFLERDGREFILARYSDRLSLILDYPISGESLRPELGSIERLYPVESILIAGDDGSQLDLASLNPQHENQYFTFGFASPGHQPRMRDESGVVWQSYVLFGLQTLEHMPNHRRDAEDGVITWNETMLRHVLLHEDGHAETTRNVVQDATNRDFDPRATTVRDERGANAYALAIARRVNHEYPDAHFFDMHYLNSLIATGLESYEANYWVDDEGGLMMGWLSSGTRPSEEGLPLEEHFTSRDRRQSRQAQPHPPEE